MKKIARILSVGLALTLLLSAFPVRGRAQVVATDRAPLALAFNLNGEAADPDQVVTSAAIADSTNYAIAAQPDTVRLLALTVTDADSSVTAGVVTVTGLDVWGLPKVCTHTFTGTGGESYCRRQTGRPRNERRGMRIYFRRHRRPYLPHHGWRGHGRR